MYLPSGREVTDDEASALCGKWGVEYLQPTGRRLDAHCCALPAGHDGPHACTDGDDGGCGLRWLATDDRGVPVPV